MLIKRSLFRFSGLLTVAAVISAIPASQLRADDQASESDPAAAEQAESSQTEEADTGESDEPSDDDGVRVQGKIIVIGPDGEKREFDFGRNFPKDMLGPRVKMFPGGPMRFRHDEDATPRGFSDMLFDHANPKFAPGDYMIGVHCEQAGEALRAQLGLGDAGLVVKTLVDDAPASKAGIQPHDVLVRIGDDELTGIDQLLDAVQEAEESALTLTIIRGGEEQTVEVTPVKREDVDLPMALHALSPDDSPQAQHAMKWLHRHHLAQKDGHAHPGHYRFERVGPGILLRQPPAAASGELQEQIDELKSQIEALQESVDKLSQGNN